ncbi:N-methyl-L-tryptophan oxidase [Algoriphagus namhaensis]
MRRKNLYDFAVIGLGAVGASTCYHLSAYGAKVIGFDRFHPPHKMGSSHGETRITRLAVGEGEDYIALVKRSHKIWDMLEKKTGVTLRQETGGILMDSGLRPWEKHGSQGFLDRTLRFAQNNEIEHRLVDSESVKENFPNLLLEPEGRAYFESEAGYLYPEKCIAVQLNLSKIAGANLFYDTPVERIDYSNPEFLGIHTAKGDFLARKVLISSGGWIKDFLPEAQANQFKICRQVLYWLEVEYKSHWPSYPVFMWGFGPQPEDFIYGFPSLDNKSIKVATESFVDDQHPDRLERNVTEAEQEEFLQTKVRPRLKGITGKVLKSEVCFYTVTSDARFVMDHHPSHPGVLWISACSGHGFKHSAALGEHMAERLLGKKPTVEFLA